MDNLVNSRFSWLPPSNQQLIEKTKSHLTFFTNVTYSIISLRWMSHTDKKYVFASICPLFNHSCHKNSKLHENTDSRSVLPFNYTTTLTARVLDSDLGSGLSAEAASIFPHGPRSLRVHCGCCKSFSYSWLTPTICPGAHLTNFNFRWACLCACVGVCVPARVHREHQHCVHPTSERAWRGEMERTTSLPI